MNSTIFKKALRLTVPVFCGYMAIGIAFGIMMTTAGYPWYLSVAMSIIDLTGTGEFFAVALFSSGAALSEILLVEFLLSIRHIFYGLSLLTKYKGAGRIKPYLIHTITDETFALIQSLPPIEDKEKFPLYTCISALDHSYWVLGTAIGALGCSVMVKLNLQSYLEGVDFALTALLIVILVNQIKTSREVLPAVAGGITAIAAVILYKAGIMKSSNIIWTTITFALGVMFLLKGKSFFKKEKDVQMTVLQGEKKDA